MVTHAQFVRETCTRKTCTE